MHTLSAFAIFSLLFSYVRAQCENLPANKAEKLETQINCSMLTTEEILDEVSSILFVSDIFLCRHLLFKKTCIVPCFQKLADHYS
jgi:hypothetical protein